MLEQEATISRARPLCRLDERLVAAMMYGSSAQGDGLSDIEFVLFFDNDALESVDRREWVTQIAPVESYFVDGTKR